MTIWMFIGLAAGIGLLLVANGLGVLLGRRRRELERQYVLDRLQRAVRNERRLPPAA